MAEQLIQNLAEPFKPAKYTDEYRSNLMKIIRAKMKGRKINVAEPEEEPENTRVLDLMSKLQASLDQGERKRPKASGGGRKKAESRAKKPARSGRKSA